MVRNYLDSGAKLMDIIIISFCEKCGSTREIDMCPMDFFKDQLEGCEIHSHRFEILVFAKSAQLKA